MSTRNRAWLLVIAVIVLGYPLAAWIIGFSVERQIDAREQLALRQAGPYASIVERSYHRGVYGATEVVTFGLGPPTLKTIPGAGGLSSLRVTVRNTIHHGPLPRLRTVALATVDTELVLPPAVQKRIDTLLGGKKVIDLHTTLGWLGGYQSDFSSPAFSGEIAPNTTLSSSGIVGTSTATHNMASATSDVTAKSLSVADNQFQLQLDDLHIKAATQLAFKELNVGDVSFTLGRLDARSKKDDEADKKALLQQVALIGKTSVTGDYLDLRGSLTAASVQAPKFTASKLGYEFSMSHVYGPSFVDLINGMRDAGRDVSADGAAASQQKLAELFRKDGIEVLVHDPVIEISRIGFVMPEGELNFSAKFAAPGLKREDVTTAGPAMTAALVQHLQAQADIRVDTDLLDKLTEGTPGNGDKFAAQVRAFEGQGYIAHDGKALTTHLVFEHGKLSVNGKPFPPGPGTPPR
jgi:uncharacterized protein YdgA (DUF945 family)